MHRDTLIDLMLRLLQDALAEDDTEGTLEATATSPLIGGAAIVTSLRLVSFIIDVESTLLDSHQVDVMLVNEQSLSRKSSPFRTIETLADYVLELIGAPWPSEVGASG